SPVHRFARRTMEPAASAIQPARSQAAAMTMSSTAVKAAAEPAVRYLRPKCERLARPQVEREQVRPISHIDRYRRVVSTRIHIKRPVLIRHRVRIPGLPKRGPVIEERIAV